MYLWTLTSNSASPVFCELKRITGADGGPVPPFGAIFDNFNSHESNLLSLSYMSASFHGLFRPWGMFSEVSKLQYL